MPRAKCEPANRELSEGQEEREDDDGNLLMLGMLNISTGFPPSRCLPLSAECGVMNVRASKKLQFGVKSLSAVRRVFYLLRIFFFFFER